MEPRDNTLINVFMNRAIKPHVTKFKFVPTTFTVYSHTRLEIQCLCDMYLQGRPKDLSALTLILPAKVVF